MPKLHPIQHAFTAGEISPLTEMRYDLDPRKYGVQTLINFFMYLQGPVETSPGFEYVGDTPGNFGRIFPFYVAVFSGFTIVVTPDTVYVNDQNGFVNKDDLVSNGDFLDGGVGWGVIYSGAAQVFFAGGSCSLAPGASPTMAAGIFQQVTTIADEPHEFVIQIAAGVGPMVVRVGTAEGLDNIFPQETFSGVESIVISDLVDSGTEMWIECRCEGATPTKILDKISCFNTSVIPERVEFPSPWLTPSEIASIQIKMVPGTLELYMTSLHTPMQTLTYTRSTRDWSFAETVFISPPPEWADGSYPAAIEFFEGRLYLGGCPNDPENFWAGRPKSSDTGGSYLDFSLGVGDPDDAIAHNIDRRGHIRWLAGSKNLVIGTENAELICTSTDGVILPGDIKVTLQSTYGSAQMQAIEVGNEILFVSPDGRKMRSMGYEWTKEAWSAKDITFGSEHITKDNELSQIHYAANPHSLVLGRTSQHQVLGCAFDPQSQTGGWFRRTTQGKIISMCVLPYAGRDEPWALIDRDEEGDQLSLERVTGGGDNVKLDSYTQLESTIGTDTFYAPHLGGMECQVLAGTGLHPNVTPAVGTGEFVLDREVNRVVIGLQFISTLKTLSRDDGMSMGGFMKGSSLPAMKRWVKIYARIFESWKPTINGKRPPERYGNAIMDLTEPPRTENVKVTNTGWEENPVITIEQDLPLKTTVIGIFGQLDQETL